MNDLTILTDQPHSRRIISLLNQAGYETRFIGGCVRDALLNRPISDIDLATSASPEHVQEILQASGIKIIPTGLQHGTVTAVIDNQSFEITTLRVDVETDGRHASIAFTENWALDAQRRDFTINALSVDLDGKIYDYCDGIQDITHRQLRFIGDATQRINEDYLRILRYFRFASVLDWSITDVTTLKICADLAPELQKLSRERIQTELYKLLGGMGCASVMSIVVEYDILKSLVDIPLNLQALQTVVPLENKHHDKDVFRRLLALIGWQNSAMLQRITVPTRENLKRLEMLDKVSRHSEWPLEKQLYFFGKQAVSDYFYLEKPSQDFTAINGWKKPVFPLKAEQLMPLTDGPGPLLGEILRAAEMYWVDQNHRPDIQELLTYSRTMITS